VSGVVQVGAVTIVQHHFCVVVSLVVIFDPSILGSAFLGVVGGDRILNSALPAESV
jgi:hypothetical protein